MFHPISSNEFEFMESFNQCVRNLKILQTAKVYFDCPKEQRPIKIIITIIMRRRRVLRNLEEGKRERERERNLRRNVEKCGARDLKWIENN